MSVDYGTGDTKPTRDKELEASLQRRVNKLLRANDWLFIHLPRNTIPVGVPGFPDLLAIRGDRLLVLELKRANKYPTQDQRQWLEAFDSVGAEVYVIRPQDFERLTDLAT